MQLPISIKNHQSLRMHNIEKTKDKLLKIYTKKKKVDKKNFIIELMSKLIASDRTVQEYIGVALYQLKMDKNEVFE